MPNKLRIMSKKTALDRIDYRILAELQNDARLSNKELSVRVHLAPSTCLERVRRLHEAGVILGAHLEVDLPSLGIGLQALIQIRLQRHSRQVVVDFQRHVLSLAEVTDLYHVGGSFDFLCQVAVRDADHLRDLALDQFTTRPEVDHLETSLIFEHIRKPLDL